jgi:phospholipase/carboxylesterase
MEQLASLDYEIQMPANGQPPKKLVFLLHGLGSNAQDLMGLVPYWKDKLKDVAFISPNAPFPCDMAPTGYQWFSLQDRSHDEMIKGIKEAVPKLNDFIDAHLEKFGLQDKDFGVVGFSQGTMLSLFTMPRRAKPCACVLGYSGALFDDGKLQNEPDSLTKMPIMLIHGTDDDVVSFSAFQDSGTILHSVGFDVQGLACQGLGHSIDENGLNQGGVFLSQNLK